MPSDMVMQISNKIHRGLLTVSGGMLGWSAAKMPVLELTTTGRKSGAKRTVMLTSPHTMGESYVVVASKGGRDDHPHWFLNLRDDPAVTVSTRGAKNRAMTARIASAEERADLWPVIIGKFKNYGGYQEKTDREIPVVILDPKVG